MMLGWDFRYSDVRSLQRRLGRIALLAVSVTALASCDNSSGPRTGKLSLTIDGLPTGTAAQVTLLGPNNYTHVSTTTEVVASLKPGEYKIASASVRAGSTRYSPLADTQTVTIAKSNVPVEASVAYAVSSGVLNVSVYGAPELFPPQVRVNGPNGFSETISATTTFAGVDPGTYFIVAPEISANQQRFAATPASRQIQVPVGLNATNVAIDYAQITGNLTFAVTGLPTGVTADISVAGPSAASYVVGTSSDLVGVRAGTYTVTANSVTSGGSLYVPNFTSQSVTLSAAATVVISVAYTKSDGPLNLTIDGITLTQVVQTYNGTVPLVSGRDGYIRVFARANQPNDVAPQVRVRFFVSGVLVNTMMLSKASGVALQPDQASLATSWNGIVLGKFIQPGLTILADVDPGNIVTEGSETDNSFPASGTPLAIDVRNVEPLHLTFVPVVQRFDQALVGNITDENKEQFLVDARRMLPLLDIDAQVHAPYTTSDSLELTSNDGNVEWLRVLAEMNALRIAESSVRHYFGVVKVSYNSGIAGYGYVPGRAVVGWDYLPSGRTVAAHELTHNFGRSHAPCGGVSGADPSYPYAGGTIGVYGYDLTTSTLRLPSSFDLMGYCANPWISDYNYVGAMSWRASNPTPDVAGSGADVAPRPTLLVWGRVERGQLILEPAFSVVTRPALPSSGGRYRIEGLARNGQVLFAYSFDGERPADVTDMTARQFAFAVPLDNATLNALSSIRLSGGGAAPATMQASLAPEAVNAALNTVSAVSGGSGSVSVKWGASAARMALIRDARTGEILSFARGGSATVRAPGSTLEVLLSDGVRSSARRIVAAPR